MVVATWNVNSIRPRMEQLLAWLDTEKPDVACLQETKVVDEDFPHAELEAAGYVHRAIHGQKTYNGVAILSRRPLHDVVAGFIDGEPDPQARLLRATVDGVRIVNGYVPNGNPLGSDKFTYKLDWLRRLTAELAAYEDPAKDLLLCGDLNIAPADADTYDPFETQGQVLCTEPERAALGQLFAWGLKDAWRKKNPFGAEYSWWDYRGSGFRYNHGFRIDHILLTASLMKRCKGVRIDRTPRSWERPSDHAPVLATLKDA
ncbi:MAG: exodeoxyribonuclease III [Alphaproteobacteria bacterium]|nr:exodeoxyribonuclease III [Alphaproteobacteria bacterium]